MAIKLRVTLTGMRKLEKAIKRIVKKTEPGTVAVVYEAHYATYVHENVGFPYQTGQAKYLESVYVEFESDIRDIFNRVSKKRGLFEGMRAVGKFVLEESKKRVPVRTGHLRDSGRLVAKKDDLSITIPTFRDIDTGD